VRGCFVTGTDTGVGKTVVAAAIAARLRRDGAAVRVFKPIITGLDEPPDAGWPPDHALLAEAAGSTAEEVVVAGYGPAVSPHLAAELAGAEPPAPRALAEVIASQVPADARAVVEGVGGLLVPLGPGGDVRTLAVALGLPLVIVARTGLGTINHTLLTVEAARAAGLAMLGVVMTPWPAAPGVIERSNRETVARLSGLEVATLAPVTAPRPELLAAAADALPLERWMG
jgi:dethiobiotin synthetase